MQKIHLLFKLLLIFLFLVNINQLSFAQISGKVFRDFNANGSKDNTTTYNETFEGNIVINAYNSSGVLLATQTTSGTGTTSNYTFPATGANSIASGTVVRLEFILPNYYFASKGNISNTTVQFKTAGAGITADLGLNYPQDYCHSTNPDIFIPLHLNGDGQQTGTTASGKALLGFPYNSTGTTTFPPSTYASQNNIGSVWGVALQRGSKKVFSTTVVRRHIGLGALGTGGIYVTNLATGTTSSFVNLQTLGVLTGTDPHSGLPADLVTPSADAATFNVAGTVGLGGVDISDNERYLYVMNLNSKELVRLDIGTSGIAPTPAEIATKVKKFPINFSCSNGNSRPWAVHYYQGAVYVGVTCDAATGTKSNLSANILKLDEATGVFSTVFTFPLLYSKGNAISYATDDINKQWQPWSNDFNISKILGSVYHSRPQALVADFEFDTDGSLVIGMLDRTILQFGKDNYDLSGAGEHQVMNSGDILRAYNNNGTYELESNGKEGASSSKPATSGAGNNEGPGGGEFYYKDVFLKNGSLDHQEISLGGLTLLKGSGEVVSTSFDPVDGGDPDNNSGGIRWYSNQDGTLTDSYRIYDKLMPGTLGKAGGLGDIELLCNPQPIEIGNLVFLDTDKDGIQDANETGIDGVIIDLYQGITKVGSTTTATLNGQVGSYFFTNANVNLNGATGILPNTAYEIRIPNISGGSKQTNLGANVLTSANQGANDLIDSDGTISSTNAIIALTTAGSGENNYSYDFGFFFCPTVTIPSATQNICIGSNGSNITVNTTQTAINGIKFMRFASAQTGAAMYTGGTLLTNGTVTASGGVATYVWNSSDFPNAGTTPIIYYVYAILNPDLGTGCQPFQEIQIVVNPLPTFTLAQSNVTCFGNGNGTITTTTTSGTSPFIYSKDDGGTFSNTTGVFNSLTPATYKIAVKDNNGCVRKCN